MRSVFAGIHAALFDLDGTLVETEIDFAAMKRETLVFAAREGLDPDELRGLDILGIVDAVFRAVARERGAEASGGVRREMLAALERIELPRCRAAVAIPSAHELLDELRAAGVKIGIVTRNCRAGVAASLARTGIGSDVLLTRDDVARTKPHPEHLLLALESLGVSPTEAVMVGDHPMDVMGGRAAGVMTVGFLRDDRPQDLFDSVRPDLVVRSLQELVLHVRAL